MNRRGFLASLGAVGLAVGTSARIERECPPPQGAVTDRRGAALRNVALPVPEEDLVKAALKDAIPAITEP